MAKVIGKMPKEHLIREYRMRSMEYEALIESAKAILKQQDFTSSAKEIFSLCKKVTGATSGYVALLNEDGSENEVLFLDSGGLLCTVDENLPMPIRGLREIAYRSSKGVYDNNFANSKWEKFLPSGHMRLDNVLFAPLNIEQKSVGLIGLANKQGGFTQRDVDFVCSLGDIAAIALRNSRNLEQIEYLTFHDPLTGLKNQRFFFLEIKRLESCADYPIAIICADVDGLKKINDTLGHQEGDLYIQQCARVLNKASDGDVLTARVGGDEFVLVLPKTDHTGGVAVIDRIDRCINEENKSRTEYPLQLSMGLAVSEDSTRPLTKTYHEADKNMYENKRRRKAERDQNR